MRGVVRGLAPTHPRGWRGGGAKDTALRRSREMSRGLCWEENRGVGWTIGTVPRGLGCLPICGIPQGPLY